MRDRVYKFAIGLSVVFVADGLFMAWALYEGGYAGLGYGMLIYFPVFIPATLVALVVIGIYISGFVRLSWSPRRAEWLFFLLFGAALTAKLIVFVRRHWGPDA